MASDSGYDIGDAVRLVRLFTDETRAAADPDDVRLLVTSPDGETIEATPHPVTDETELAVCAEILGVDVDTGTGLYTAMVDLDQSGLWRYEWQGIGTLPSAEQGSLLVRRRRVGEPGS